MKESGRGGFAFFHARDAQTAAFGEPVAKALRRALEKEEVFLYYRPRLWAGTGKLAGAQALLHWWHPRRGLIGAGDFVPAAVQAGLALPLSEWLAERLCTDIAGWHKAGVAVPHVSLPLHEGFHQRLNMVALLQRALRCHGLSPDGVLLETNAEVLARHLENDTTAGRMLRARGPKVLLSGGPWEEQTLTRLLRFPVVGLVLKEQWVRSATHQPVELAVLRGVVTTAHSLNLPVVATGVDDAPTMAALSRLGVDQVQGSHVDGPLLTAADVSLKGRFLLE